MKNILQKAHVAAAGAADNTYTKGLADSSLAKLYDLLSSPVPPTMYPSGVTIFQQGSAAPVVYLIDKGLIKLSCLGEDGQELIVGLRYTGWILGAASAILQKPHPVTAATITECQLHCLPREFFLELAKTNPQFGWRLQQVHSREVYDQASQLVGLHYLSARRRLEQLVRKLTFEMKMDLAQRPVRLRLPLKYWEIAQLIGVTPEHLSRVLKQVEEAGIMYRENGTLIISDPEKLYHSLE